MTKTRLLLALVLVVSVGIGMGVACGDGEPAASAAPAREASVAAPRTAATPAAPSAGRSGDPSYVEMTPELAAAGVTELELRGPYDPVTDAMHPDGTAKPALGGRVIVHQGGEPANLNFSLLNSSSIRAIYRLVHEPLLDFDPVLWDYVPVLATGWDLEDTLILAGGRGEGTENVLFGKVEERDDAYVVRPGSGHNGGETRTVPKDEVESLERGTVYTLRLREDAVWHDGHPFDAEDVLFSLEIFDNPHAGVTKRAYKFEKVHHVEVVEPYVVRVFWREQYFATTGSFSLDLPILPRHLYDLHDPDNEHYDPTADLETRGEFFQKSPYNREWVGLGPYRVTNWERGQYLEAERFDGYWSADPAVAGYFDTIRWRFIPNDSSAWQALLNGEVDIFERVSSADFFGQGTRDELFTSRLYKAFTYVGNIAYVTWNMRRPHLSDVRVRTALAHAYDMQGWIESNYQSHALWATFTMFWFGPGYDHTVEPKTYDPERAEELLLEAGWYDRDGDGVVDKDGKPLVIEFLGQAGNSPSLKFIQSLQDAYSKIGVKVDIISMEWASVSKRLHDRDFDACFLMWGFPTPESDPFQQWHGSESGSDTSNHPGFSDPEVDRLIEAGRRELDPAVRQPIWHQIHRRVHDAQPYLFGINIPRKLAFNRSLHGLKLYKWSPGYRLRDLYYAEGTPGTRPLGD